MLFEVVSHMRIFVSVFSVLFSVTILQSAYAQESMCYGGCDPISRHRLSWLNVNNGYGVIKSYSNLDVGGVASALEVGCKDFASANSDAYATVVIENCKGRPSVGWDWSGGPWTSFDFQGDLYRTRNSDGALLNLRKNDSWSMGAGGCNASKIGIDGQCYCPTGSQWNEARQLCAPYVDRYHDKPQDMCSAAGNPNPRFGNPIYPLTGSKRQAESLGIALGRESIELIYETRSKVPSSTGPMGYSGKSAASFGTLWSSAAHKMLAPQITGSYNTKTGVQASRGGGGWVSFVRDNAGRYIPDGDVPDRLETSTSGWNYWDLKASTLEQYNGNGAIQSLNYGSGQGIAYAYSDSSTPTASAPSPGLIIALQDSFGRRVGFQYEQPTGATQPRVFQITDAMGQTTQIRYDAAGNLSQLIWPDGAIRDFVYENPSFTWALTGIIDENGDRFSTYGYDAEGRANDTQYAGGVAHYRTSSTKPPVWIVHETYDESANVIWRDHYWQSPEAPKVQLPFGSTLELQATSLLGIPRLLQSSQPAGSGCAAASSAITYDTNGNIASRKDFSNRKVCYANDLTRNLETARIEGYLGSDACPSNLATATPTVGTAQRKVTTQWHPFWRLEVRRAEPKLITTFVYNGQPDPTNGDAIASCAPADAKVIDQPIAVLCKRVEQPTTDDTGAKDFTAANDGTARVWTYTYNQYGQVLTANGPRTDAPGGKDDATTYTYYADTVFDASGVGHTLGDLATETNALGHVINYGKYDKNGRLLEKTDADGVKTTQTWHVRGWLTSVTRSAGGLSQTTTYDYDKVGQLKKVTEPDTSWVAYTYDAAHRLTDVADSRGNSVHYTLDAMGNRTAEDWKDTGGALRRAITRSYDALNRLQAVTGAAQ